MESLREFGRRQLSKLPLSLQDSLRHRLSRFRQPEIRRPIERATRAIRNVSVVQIGSNDGTSGDPLYGLIRKHREWSALLVEPLPEVFRRLTETYGTDRRFSYADVAIAGSPGRVSFFYIDEAILTDLHNVRSRVSQISSLDRTHVEKHLAKLASQLNVDPATMNKYIRTTEIEAITLPELLVEFKVQKIDILHIDAEGHDWVVLSQLDFSRWQPKVILFEHGHLSGSDLKQAHVFLEAYDLQPIGMDTLCIRR